MIFLSVTHSARTKALSGIQSVTRGIAVGAPEVIPVSWFARREYFHLLPAEWSRNLGREPEPSRLPISSPRDAATFLLAGGKNHRAPLHRHPAFRSKLKGAWLLMPELMDPPEAFAMIHYAREHGMRPAAIFHDAIPLQRPELTNRPAATHARYIEALNGCDMVISVSAASAAAFQEFGGRAPVCVCPLPAEVVGSSRVTEVVPRDPASETITILCVSTLEPRKNHDTLLAAFEQACAGAIPMRLQLAGDRFANMPEVAERVEAAVQRNANIQWFEGPSPDQLRGLYRQCDFTVYPSFLEGFGLPVVESLWFGKPCICANFGVMAENAAGGGCFTIDVRDKAALTSAILTLAKEPQLRQRLSREAIARPLRTWVDYAREIRSALD